MKPEHVALRIEDTRDDQARLALADGRLLPPPAVMTEACRILRDRQINAWPGTTGGGPAPGVGGADQNAYGPKRPQATSASRAM